MSGTRPDGKPNDHLPGDVIASIVRNGVCLKVGSVVIPLLKRAQLGMQQTQRHMC